MKSSNFKNAIKLLKAINENNCLQIYQVCSINEKFKITYFGRIFLKKQYARKYRDKLSELDKNESFVIIKSEIPL